MFSSRIVLGIISGFCALVLGGCSSATPTSGSTGESSATGTSAKTKSTATNPASTAAAKSTAQAFLRSVLEGKVSAATLSPDFRKTIAPPVTASDQERGFSEWAVGEWFKPLVPRIPQGPAQETELAPGVVVVHVAGTDQVGSAWVKLVQVGSDWIVESFHLAPIGAAPSLPETNRAAEWAFFAFLNPTLTNNMELSEAVLTLSLKSRVAPPLPGDQDYNKSILKSKLSQLRGNAVTYTINKRNIGPESGTMDGSLLGPGEGNAREVRPFSVKLVKGTKPGEWLVDDFEPR